MIKRSVLSIMLASAGVFGLAHVPASAAPIPVVQQGVAGQVDANPLATEVKHFKNRRHRDNGFRWNRKRHGDRCRYRRAGCNYFHGGYYYRSPFWLSAPFIGGSVIIGGGNSYRYGNRHVQWCMDRYRSYRPRSNTWVSYSGNVNQCISPYGP